MTNSILAEITSASIANEVRLERSGSKIPVLIVEGVSDSILYKRLLADEEWSFVTSFGKDRALEAIESLDGDGVTDGYLAILDADFDLALDIKRGRSVVLTDFLDIEINIIESNAFHLLLAECTNSKKISDYEEKHGEIKKSIYDALMPYSAARMLNSSNQKPISFDEIGLKHITGKTVAPDIDKLFRQIAAKMQSRETAVELQRQTVSYLTSKRDPRIHVRGRDFIEIFSEILKTHLSSNSTPKCDKFVLEKMLRIDKTTFNASRLAYEIHLWRDNLK